MTFLTQGKTNWKFVAIVVIFAFIVGGGILGWIKKKEIVYPQPPPLIKEKPAEPEKSKAVFICEMLEGEDKNFCLGIVQRNISFCNKAGELKDDCLDQVASLTKNIELCRTIEGYCYYYIAAATRNPEICKEVRNEDICLSKIAGYNRDASFCDSIEDEKQKIYCQYIVKNDPLLCEKLEKITDRSRCLGGVALREKNPAFCEKIESRVYKLTCYQTLAVRKKDASICEGIFNIGLPQPEYDYLLCKALVKEDISFCQELEDKGYIKEECLFLLATRISKADLAFPAFGYVPVED